MASTCGSSARTPGPASKPEYVAELHDPSWFMEMVPKSDVLVAAAPLTPETERMFNEQVFRRMKKTAYFLALSRGKLFDDMALVRALQEGWIAGAGLDVFPAGAAAARAPDLRLPERGDDAPTPPAGARTARFGWSSCSPRTCGASSPASRW